MCGISGFIDFNKNTNEVTLHRMTRSMNHRGPDGEGYFYTKSDSYFLGFGHKRLSIIDLSSGGTQPMHYRHFSILLNGEIYNYAEIKQELINLNHIFVSSSDTEVVLHAYIEWGENCLKKFVGMFAILIYNAQTHQLFCARDRAGVKPFYYYWHQGLFLFSSELKAFHEHEHFIKSINQNAIATFLQFGYIPAPHCIFNNTYKLEAGHILEINLQNKKLEIKKYWSVIEAYNKPKLDIDFKTAKSETEKRLDKAFNYRMLADVPVGVFLSGGYDSTCVAAILSQSNQLKTFTIGVGDEKINEATYAKQIAKHLGTNHTEHYCTEQDALDIIKELPFFFDEPFGDSSAIPTILVSAMAKKNVTVALSADGGDEIFAGYNRYAFAEKYLGKIQKTPKVFRNITNGLINMIPLKILSKDALMPYRFNKIRQIINAPNNDAIIKTLCSVFSEKDAQAIVYNTSQPLETFKNVKNINKKINDNIAQMQAMDYQVYMCDDVLQKVDRATMSVSLEGREPFLDQNIIEFVAQLPTNYKYHNGEKKYILKEIVHQYIPKQMMDRPKMGFIIPIEKWLQQDLKNLVENYLNEQNVKKYNLLNFAKVNKIKQQFNNGKLEYTERLWHLLMFQMWCEKWM